MNVIYRVRLQVRVTRIRNNRVPTANAFRFYRRISRDQKLQMYCSWWSVHLILKRHHIIFLPGPIRERGRAGAPVPQSQMQLAAAGSSPPTSTEGRGTDTDRPVGSGFLFLFHRFPIFLLYFTSLCFILVLVFYFEPRPEQKRISW